MLCSTRCAHVQDDAEIDECICSVKCDGVHDDEDTGPVDTRLDVKNISEDIKLGIKYCPGLDIELPRYIYREYKPRYSSSLKLDRVMSSL